MPFAAARSRHPIPTHAAGEVIGSILERVGEQPDLLVLFATPPFAGALEDLVGAARQILDPSLAVAMVTGSVLTGGDDAVDPMAIGLFAASFAQPYDDRDRIEVITFGHDRPAGSTPSPFADRTGTLLLLLIVDGDDRGAVLLDTIQDRNPDLVIVGATVSADAVLPPLSIDGAPVAEGAVGVWFPPGLPVRAVSSQGSRPVGEPLVVTAARPGFVEELAGRPALDVVLDTAADASVDDRRALARGVNLGIVLSEGADEPRSGDVRVLPVPGADRTTGAIAIDADVPIGTTVQIRARDRRAIEDDLLAVLAGEASGAALVFRDEGAPGENAPAARTGAIVEDHVDRQAVAGAGVGGVIGPVGDRSWPLLGGTAVLLFDP